MRTFDVVLVYRVIYIEICFYAELVLSTTGTCSVIADCDLSVLKILELSVDLLCCVVYHMQKRNQLSS